MASKSKGNIRQRIAGFLNDNPDLRDNLAATVVECLMVYPNQDMLEDEHQEVDGADLVEAASNVLFGEGGVTFHELFIKLSGPPVYSVRIRYTDSDGKIRSATVRSASLDRHALRHALIVKKSGDCTEQVTEDDIKSISAAKLTTK